MLSRYDRMCEKAVPLIGDKATTVDEPWSLEELYDIAFNVNGLGWIIMDENCLSLFHQVMQGMNRGMLVGGTPKIPNLPKNEAMLISIMVTAFNVIWNEATSEWISPGAVGGKVALEVK